MKTLFFLFILLPLGQAALAQGTVIDNGSANKWIFHNPNDSRKVLIAAPSSGSSWNWGKSFQFRSDGRLKFEADNAGMWFETGSNDWFLGLSGRSYLRVYFGGSNRMTFRSNGNVGIGTDNPTDRLSVNGTIRSREVRVTSTGWPDYVFGNNYALPSLSEVEQHITLNKHLPGIPSAAEVEAEGVALGDISSKLLQKIEELTLYVIAQDKKIKAQQTQIEALQAAQ